MTQFKSIFFGMLFAGFCILGFQYKNLKAQPNFNSLAMLNPITKSKNIFSFFSTTKSKPKKIIFGYLPYWSIEKIKYMQLDKLTDIAYFGLYIKDDGTFVVKNEDGTNEPGYDNWHNSEDLSSFIKFAQKSGTRISLTVVSHNDEISDKFLKCEDCWKKLVDNLKVEMDLHKITDVNMNFEYVDFQDKEMSEKYTKLVGYINDELDKTYGSSYVTVATFADSFINPRITDVEALGKISDGLFIMAYDFRSRESDSAGPVSPVAGIGEHSSYDLTTMINDYLRVVPPSKLIMGVPYYGYNWVVEDDKAMSKRIEGDDQNGFSESQSFADIMDLILDIKPDVKWDEISKGPFFSYEDPDTKSKRQVYYENSESLKIKYELVNRYALGGIGIWALGYDGGYQELWDLLGTEFVD